MGILKEKTLGVARTYENGGIGSLGKGGERKNAGMSEEYRIITCGEISV